MQIFDAGRVHELLGYPSLIAALRAAHRSDAMPDVAALVLSEKPPEENKFVSLVAWSPRDVIAVKLVGVFPGNPVLATPQPSVQGLVALFSGQTGAPIFAADGAAMTFRKTAADSALGADYLARPDAEVLLVIGAGGLAPHVIRAHTAMRPSIRRVLVWNRTFERAQILVESLSLDGATLEPAPDLDEAVAAADVISSVTMATKPLIRGALLRPGAHVDLIGAYLPDMREADDDVVRRAHVFVVVRKGCTGSGDICGPMERGLLTTEAIEADLFDLCTGRHPGRTDRHAITMYKNVGGGHLDLFTARHLMSRAATAARSA